MSERCNAELHIGDDHGDNHATMICQLDKGHSGKHIEQYGKDVVALWDRDDRESTNN